jgi:hypothetical protein
LRTCLIIALAASLVGCSHQPPQQAAAYFANKKAKPTTIATKIGQKPRRIPLPRPSLRAHHEPKSNAETGSDTIRSNIAASHPALDPVANSNYETTREAVTGATGVAGRMTTATALEAHNGGEPVGGVSTNKTDHLVALVMVRPEVGSISDLTGKDIAIDERYSASSNDVEIAIVVAGARPVFQLSLGRMTAIDRLIQGEVPAAVVTVVSADAAEKFPEIPGFKIFRIPLSPTFLKARP